MRGACDASNAISMQPPELAALAADMLEEIDVLRARLRRAGLEP